MPLIPVAPTTADTTDPYLRGAQTFPHLTPEMVARILPYGQREDLSNKTCLYVRGQRNVDFFVILSGEVVVFETGADGTQNIITRHDQLQFTGELDHFNGREILVLACADGAVSVLRLGRAAFRQMVSSESDIAEVVMLAFILRRVGLIKHGHGGVTLLGPGNGGDTLRIQRFLTRNGYPLHIVDTNTDPDTLALRASFGLDPDDLPVVVLPGHNHEFRPPHYY